MHYHGFWERMLNLKCITAINVCKSAPKQRVVVVKLNNCACSKMEPGVNADLKVPMTRLPPAPSNSDILDIKDP